MWNTKTYAALEKRLLKANTLQTKLVKQKNELLGRSKIRCGHCKHTGKIMDMVFIQPYWYERPHGCMGGDTWHETKGARFDKMSWLWSSIESNYRTQILRFEKQYGNP